MHGWWVLDAWNASPLLLGAWVFWIIFSICLHELGHGWAAIHQGDPTPITSGHMTWNPFVHMGPQSLLLFALVGYCWGAMPVNPWNFRSRYGESIVAAAGPLVNLILAAFNLLCLAVAIRVMHHGSLDAARGQNLFIFLFVGMQINLMLMLFNLIPVPPLDGSRIAANLVPSYRRLLQGDHGNTFATIGFILVFFVFGQQVNRFSSELGFRLLHAVT